MTDNKLPIHEVMVGDYPKFLIIANDDVEYRMEFEVHEVTSWECDDKHTPGNTELYVCGVIKGDGCSQAYFGEEDYDTRKPDGYLHPCGKQE